MKELFNDLLTLGLFLIGICFIMGLAYFMLYLQHDLKIDKTITIVGCSIVGLCFFPLMGVVYNKFKR